MALVESRTPPAAEDPNRDLGFGAVVARESRKRFLNKDGSFNVVREGLSFFRSLSPYHYMLTTTWPRFLGLVVLFFLVTNAVFGAAYFACGPGEIAGSRAVSLPAQYLEDFFFSVQTFATIGYGGMYPAGLAANVLVTLESLVSLLGFALATGILFSRFSRPTAQILFSERAIIAPYKEISAFEFRVANIRRNELIQVEARVMLTRLKRDGSGNREFLPMALERDKVVFFPLAWTIVHPIDEASPLWGATPEGLNECDAEFLVLFSGIDETFSQTVHTRSSYKPHEVVWGARFTNLFNPPKPDGVLSIDIGRLHNIERVLPPAG
ncbi:MAG TPA: ion channel [Thermoanaerobaculia bacterium]|jgi:inward rectifier potassium channel